MQSESPHAMPRRCGAKTRSGEPCKNAPVTGSARCRMHGGKSLKGIASARYRHGMYSRYVPAPLLHRVMGTLTAEDDEAVRQTFRDAASREVVADTPCKPNDPMEEVREALAADDFEAARTALEQLYGEGGELYRPPVPRDAIRDVRQEWRGGVIARGQTHSFGTELVWTELPSGGWRPWFVCSGCGRRCALLFHGRCRSCEGIRYESQYSTSDEVERLREKARELRRRLGSWGGLFAHPPRRPKRMRRATYAKLLDELEAIEVEAAGVVAADTPGFVAGVREGFDVARRYEAFREKHPGW